MIYLTAFGFIFPASGVPVVRDTDSLSSSRMASDNNLRYNLSLYGSEAFMPWIALVGPELEENLSLRYLASSLAPAGFLSEIIALNNERHFVPSLGAILGAKEPPLMVGLSLAFQWRAKDFLAFAVALRQGGYQGHITVGGHFATFASLDILRDFPEIDSICRQESEETMVTLAKALVAQQALDKIPGLGLRNDKGAPFLTAHPSLPDLATLPWPDRRGEPAACFDHRIAPLVSSRGCYANCTFCCIAAWHEQTLPGKRYRLRDVNDVADEMVYLQKTRRIEVFVFHDDNFFIPSHQKNVDRFNALADALEARGMGRFATVVKARPTDADPEVFRILKERLHCIRIYIGIETDADQGLKTLRRWAHSKQNHEAIELVRGLNMYTCFNMLLFDPDTTVESIETNIAFLRDAAEFPSNFGRVELYAGTPLLYRMQQEKRVVGDYMQWDYSLASPEVERIFSLSMEAFEPRNFGDDALANRIMGTRFDVEVCRHFHPDLFLSEWDAEGKRLSRELSMDTADGLEAIVNYVKANPTKQKQDSVFIQDLSQKLRATEARLNKEAVVLAQALQQTVKQGKPLTEIGDKVATPLQRARAG